MEVARVIELCVIVTAILHITKPAIACEIFLLTYSTEGNFDVEFLVQLNLTFQSNFFREKNTQDIIIMKIIENNQNPDRSYFLERNEYNIYKPRSDGYPTAAIQMNMNEKTGFLRAFGHVNGQEILHQTESKIIRSANCNSSFTKNESAISSVPINQFNTQPRPITKFTPSLSLIDVNNNNNNKLNAVVEVLVIIDYKNAEYFNFDESRIQSYVRVFYNSVNNRFRNIKEPKITIIVTGIHIIQDYDDQKFLRDAYNKTTDNYDIEEVLSNLSSYIKDNEENLPKHDVVQFISSEVLVNKNNRVVSGDTYLESACYSTRSRYYGVSIVSDLNGSFQGVQSASVQLAHLIGSGRDGTSNNCYNGGGYIMSTQQSFRTKENFYFSSCSIASMKAFIESKNASCLRSFQAPSFYSYPNILPGDILDLNAQCRVFLNTSDVVSAVECLAEEQICTTLLCRTKVCPYSYEKVNVLPADNSPCDLNKVCLYGKCVLKSEQIAWQDQYFYADRLHSSGNSNYNSYSSNYYITISLIFLRQFFCYL